jgi:DNA (cytosine-5)-methyltransferase 1
MSRYWDMFCGAGGASNGLARAARRGKVKIDDLVAANHWKPALDVHKANHPWARHYQEDVRRIDPRKEVGVGVKLGVAGPDCTHHSNARGGKPRSAGQRALAWDVVRWARLTEAENLLIENVPEFATWGPLDDDGNRIKARQGEYFEEFLGSLRRLGYAVDWRIFNSADYGDATKRHRLFVQARQDGRILWPEPTHSENPEENLFGGKRWRSAAEIIDWSLPGESIFTRKKPLAPKTMERILNGIRRFAHEPFLAGIGGPTGRQVVRSLKDPLPTVLGQNHSYLITPFVLPQLSCGAPRSVDAPLMTITATGTGNGLCIPFLTAAYGERKGQLARVHDIDAPLPTTTGENRFGLVQPFLVGYYGTGHAHDLSAPLPTATGRDRFGLVEPITALDGSRWIVADILYRMLQPHELAAAHSFPPDYQWAQTNKGERVRLVGNSWPVELATALVGEMIS